MKLPENEKETIDLLHTITGQPVVQIREVFIALLFLLTAEIHRGKNQVSIPMFGDFKITYEKIPQGNHNEIADQTFVKLSPIIKSVLLDVAEGRETSVNKYIKEDIVRYFAKELGVKVPVGV